MPAVANDTSSIDQAIEQFNGVIIGASEKVKEILKLETKKLYETLSNPPRYSVATRSSVQPGTFNRSEISAIHISFEDEENTVVLNNDGRLYRFKSISANIHGHIVSYLDMATMQEVSPEDYVHYGKKAFDKIKQAYQNDSKGDKPKGTVL